MALVSCANGNAPDANEARQRAATESPILGPAQVTAIATRFFAASPTPIPTRPPRPVLAELAIASAIEPDGAPRTIVRSVPASGTMYVTALIRDVPDGARVVASLGTIDAQFLFSTEMIATSPAAAQWFALQWNLDGSVEPGRYAAFVFVDGEVLESIVFEIR